MMMQEVSNVVTQGVGNSKPLLRAPELLYSSTTEQQKLYWDRSYYDSPESQMKALEKSSTLYVGNLAFSTRSQHVLSHFSQIGPISQVIMGLDRFHHTPCGFCFVEYVHRDDALCAVANLSSTKLDGRVIRVELDAGFQEGRQYGRGASGGQVRDERRQNLDAGRQHKRTKPLNWTPPEHVLQQQHQQQEGTSAGEMTAPPGDGMGQPQQQQDAGQEPNPRFRDE
ncbi:RNA recognition motif containing protein [Nitzschia inconspicua]|uniref:Nuclear cap-binding protein subunit 2 n=1 Tax=Nitzschia inconspicua TaxID=303405 RepID=A0A9K3PTV9_9STRA|nr:RNA recognition motif containing protein [Nitzschia inconspicua]